MTVDPKHVLRTRARERRRGLVQAGFAAALARHAEALMLAPGTLVGGYHALPEEADPALLLARLAVLGCAIAFPRVTARQAQLDFHCVPDGEALHSGAYGIAEPLAHWPVARPDLLLVPLLAFDAHGHRLGYGGGYYDRTLAALPGVPAIGIAYAGQALASLPHGPHDMALNGILTEQGLRRFP